MIKDDVVTLCRSWMTTIENGECGKKYERNLRLKKKKKQIEMRVGDTKLRI